MQALNLVQKKKKKVNEIMKDIKATDDKEKQLKLYKDILNIVNTDRKIIYQYLLLVKQIRKITDKKENPVVEIMTFIHHFPPEQYNKEFVGYAEKKYSSMEKILLILNKILSKHWKKTTFEERREATLFFLKAIKEDQFEIKNTSPITWENDELYIYNSYLVFLEQIKRKMEHYSSSNIIIDIKSDKIIKCDKFILDIKQELQKEHPDSYVNKMKQCLEQFEENKKMYMVIEGNFFIKYLSGFHSFLNKIKDTYLKELSIIKFEKEEDKNIFEYFMLFISSYNFENITQDKLLVWKYSFYNSENYEEEIKKKLIEQYKQNELPLEVKFEKDNKLIIINPENMEEITIENYDDYELHSLILDIQQNQKFNKVKAIKYVKIPKINNHLYIKKIFDEWVVFNLCTFNSKTIKTLYGTLFKEQEPFILDEKEMTIVLKNITFYSFDTDFAGSTNKEAMKIYEYANYDNLIDIYDKGLSNEDVLKVIFLAFNLIVNFHEILGHLNIRYQRFNYGQEKNDVYNSPKVDKNLSSDYAKSRNNVESGEDIEIKLFGRVISDLTLKEALFILNPSNYIQNDYDSFRQKFMKCNTEKIIIDEVFYVYLKKTFDINPENIIKAENKKYSFDDLIKKSTGIRERYAMKRKHPIGYRMDGLQKEDYDYVDKLLKTIENLDETTIFDIKDFNK